METPPCSSARRVGWFPDGAGADLPLELDDRQEVFIRPCALLLTTPLQPRRPRSGCDVEAHQARR
jgi:hypothetical protein